MKKYYQENTVIRKTKALLLAICMLVSVVALVPFGAQMTVGAEGDPESSTTVTNEQDLTGKVKAMQLREWREIGSERTVSVESGKTYTFSLLYRYITGGDVSVQLSNNAVGGTYVKLVGNSTLYNGSKLDRNTGRISYTFTSQGTTLGLGCYLNGNDGERRAYIADLKLYESDAQGNAINDGAVIDCESDFNQSGIWNTYYSYTASIETLDESFFSEEIPGVLSTLDVGYTLTPAFDSKTYSYAVTVPYSVTKLDIETTVIDGATLGEVTGNEDFVVGTPKDVVISVNDADGSVTKYTVTVTREQDLTGKVKAMQLREWREIGSERTVSVESGKTYTFSLLYRYITGGDVSVQLSNNAVGGTYVKLVGNSTLYNGAKLDRNTGRISYTFTSQGTTLGLGCYLNGNDNVERHAYIADLKLYESDAQGNAIDDGAVIDCESDFNQSGIWNTYYSYTASIETIDESFFSEGIPGVLSTLDVGYTLTPAFNSKTYSYAVTVPYSVTKLDIETTVIDGATLGEVTGNEDFVVGTPKDVVISVNDADGSVTKYTVTVTRQQDSSDMMTAMRIHEWNTDAGLENTVTVEAGKTYTFNVYWKHVKGENPCFIIGGDAVGGYKTILIAKTPQNDQVSYNAATGLLSYTFTAEGTNFIMSAQMGSAGGEKDFWFANPTVFESDANGNKTENGSVIDCDAKFVSSWPKWSYGGDYRIVDLVDSDFFTVYGDANQDGTFNIMDLIRAKKFAANMNVTINMEVLGKDKTETSLSATDLSNIKKWLLNDEITPTKTIHTKTELQNLANYLTYGTDNYAIGLHTYGGLDINERIKTFVERTGKKPAYIDFDMNALPFSQTGDIQEAVSELTKFAENGGFITISDHWLVPTVNYADATVGGANNSRATLTSEQFADVMTQGTTLNTNFTSELKITAQFLSALKANGVPVIYRPMHEANASWFWWGINADNGITGTDVSNLYKYVHDYYNVTCGLDNIIWEFCPSINGGQSTLSDWYPGDNYVDILAVDWYLPNINYKEYYDIMNTQCGSGKPFALAEFGGDGEYNLGDYPLSETLGKIETFLDQGAKVGYVGIYSTLEEVQNCQFTARTITGSQMAEYWSASKG